MRVLQKRKVANAYGYMYKLCFKNSRGEKVYSIDKNGSQYGALVNLSYTTFEKEIRNVLEFNK